MTDKSAISLYAPVIIKLLQGVIYNDDRHLWDNLINYEAQVKEYLAQIGLDLHIYESDGFAFLKQKRFDDAEGINMPEIVRKTPLGYYATMLCVLLVERLIEFDVRGGDDTRLILGKEDIKEMIRIFLPEGSNEAKFFDKIDIEINRLVDYGFLRKLNNAESKYEVKRILKAKVSADTLQEIKQKLQDYAKSP